jgi:ferredoxin--NADP+ reductase
MTHVILGHCCKDASCVQVCPQNCIHPIPGEIGFGSAETLHIDPVTCIDCTACVDACPASAIKPERDLTAAQQRYARRNREFFQLDPVAAYPPAPPARFEQPLGAPADGLRIAVVGAGPAAMYTVRELLRRSSSVRITVFEKDGAVGGLLRDGVSRDQVGVRGMIRLFDVPFSDDRVRVVYHTEVGVAISVADLTEQFDAVVLACGATEPRQVRTVAGAGEVFQALDILRADNMVAPDARPPILPGPRCIIVGAGNVALDVVRYLARTRGGASAAVAEVVVLSRSAADRVSFTRSAFDALRDLPDVELVVDRTSMVAPVPGPDGLSRELSRLPAVDLPDDNRQLGCFDLLRIVLSFGQNATSIVGLGPGDVAVGTAAGRTFRANSVICAAGFEMKRIDGVPVGPTGAVPNRQGRVLAAETGEPLDRLYVVGWARRGATGGVGDNRTCAAETVAQLTRDLAAKRATR